MRIPAKHLPTLSLLLAALSSHAQMPSPIDPPAGVTQVLRAQGDGFQVYTCTVAASAVKWTLKAPDAKLLDATGKVIGSHFAGPTWKLDDGALGSGEVQGELVASQPSLEAGSVPWLLLRAKAGTATGALAPIAYIRRTETHGGVAPATGCAAPEDAGKTARIAYTATYTFYAAPAAQ